MIGSLLTAFMIGSLNCLGCYRLSYMTFRRTERKIIFLSVLLGNASFQMIVLIGHLIHQDETQSLGVNDSLIWLCSSSVALSKADALSKF